MNDSVLLIIGICVFGLMLIAIVLTIFEFHQLDQRRRQAGLAKTDPLAANTDPRFDDRD